MKHKIILSMVLITSIFGLAGCNNQNSSIISSNTNINLNTRKVLSTSSSILTLSMYDELDLSNFVVNGLTYENDELIETIQITDYELINTKNNKTIYQGYIFNETGLNTIEVKKDGYISTTFTIKVNPSTKFSQSISISSLPTKTKYKLNETFLKDGLSVNLYTYYVDSNNKEHSLTKTIDNYTLSIDDKQIDSYTYLENGLKRVKVSYQGYNEELTAEFSTFCLKDEYHPLDISSKQLMEEEDLTMNLNISNTTKSNEDKGYLSPDEIDISYDLHEFSNTNSYINWRYMPSKGDVPLLIVPVVIPTYEELATCATYSAITKAFNGSSSDLNFESVHSYYYKSSYGQLDLHTTITDYYYLSTDSDKFNILSSIEDATNQSQLVCDLGQDCLNWAEKTYNLDLTEYDYDKNGTIDGIWMVYIHPYTSRGSLYWAFSGYASTTPNIEKPTVSNYGWIGYEFILGEYSYDYDNNPDVGCDAHVVIHETGHMLGLNDYYDTNKINEEANLNNPLGNIDIMASDIGDQNPYSKMMLGWIKPYIVYGNADISLKTFQSKDQVILIPDDNKDLSSFTKLENGKYQINIFDEYLVLDYYTKKGLNEQDYPSYNVKTPTDSGLRIYHTDARLAKVSQENGTYIPTLLDDPSSCLSYEGKDLYRVITNTLYETFTTSDENKFDEIRWISTNKTKMYANTSLENRIFTNVNDTFKIESDNPQFINGLFNSTKSCSYQIKITSFN